MANMGYCRFSNTVSDLKDCYDHMDDEDLSDEEKKARLRLIKTCEALALPAPAKNGKHKP